MAEYEVWTEVDYTDNVSIDFALMDRKEKADLIKAIINNNEYEFHDVDLHYAGDVYVDIEPNDWR